MISEMKTIIFSSSLFALLSLISLFSSGFWIAYLFRKFKECYKSYVDAKLACEYSSCNAPNVKIHYSSMVRYALLLCIMIIETVVGILVGISSVFPNCDLYLYRVFNVSKIVDICDETNIEEYKKLSHFSYFRQTTILYIIPAICVFISFSLTISVMKLTVAQLKFVDAWDRVRASHYRWLLVSVLLWLACVILAFISYTTLFVLPIICVITLGYLQQFYLNTKRLKKALMQYANERLAQFGQNRAELLQLKRFTFTSSLLTLGLLSVALNSIANVMLFIVVSILYYGECFIPLIYPISYTPLLSTTQQQVILFKFIEYFTIASVLGYAVTASSLLVPFYIATFVIMFTGLYKKVRKVKTRFSYESLDENLISRTSNQ